MIKRTLLLISLTTTLFSFAQKDSIYYFKGNYIPATEKTAVEYKVLKRIEDKLFTLTTYDKSDEGWQENSIIEKIKIISDNVLEIKEYRNDELVATFTRNFIKSKENLYNYTTLDDKGNIIEKGKTKTKIPLKKDGEITRYYSSGKVSNIASYKDGVFVSNKMFTKKGEQYTENICPLPDKYPKITNGMYKTLSRHIQKKFSYPEAARYKNIQGRVYISFTLNENLEVVDVHVAKSVEKSLDEEAVRIIKSFKPTGDPAFANGKKVAVRYEIPISFKLAD